MKRILSLFVMLTLCFSLFGGPIDETTAKQLAQNFWKENNTMGVRGGKVFKKKTDEARFVNVAAQHGYSEFFIFNNTAGKGYVIMAADDCVTPILGYSYENNFDEGELPPNFKAWLDGYALQIEEATAMKLNATDEIRNDWECLRQSKTLPIKSDKAVSPLVQTKWNQAPYYNAQCPYDYNENTRTLTGCTATAMAQVMKYWSYPEHGYGSHSYVPYSHPEYGTLYADFSAVDYQWSSMPNTVNSANDAVATLMYHCGVSVEMRYGPYSSGAYIIDYGGAYASAETALKTYFDYKNTLHSIQKNNYSDSEWIEIIKNELDNSRPMVYGGFSDSGGHAFVCDGYNANNYFHFNWGWGGSYDDYFYINSLNPGSHSYSQNQQALIGIEPNQSGGGGGGGGGGSSSNYDLVYYADLSATETEYWFYDDMSVHAEIANIGDASFSGYIGAAVYWKNDNDEYIFLNVMDYWDKTSNPLQSGSLVRGDLECAGGPPYLPGSYGIAILYSLDGDLWNFIDNNGYNDVFFDIVYEQDIETFSNFEIVTGDFLYYGMSSTVNVDVWNSGNTTFYGYFRVNLANLDGSWAQNIAILDCTDGLGANYHYENGLNFSGEITVEPGSYYMELAYQTAGESTWYYAGAYAYPNPVRTEVAIAPVDRDPYEANDTANSAYTLPCYITSNSTTTVSTTGANLHSDSDVDYYKINLSSDGNYIITPRLYDSYNSDNGSYYTVDAMFAYSADGTIWSEFYDDVISESFAIGSGTLYFCVRPYFEGFIGTYQLDINITNEAGGELTLDPYEYNNTASGACAMPYAFSGNSATINTTGSNFHNETDIDYYKIQLYAGKNYTITPRLHDSYNSGNGLSYTVDAVFAYSTDGVNWSEYYDDEAPVFTANPGPLYFCVKPYYEGDTGTYLLSINITFGTGVEESDETLFSAYPNPVTDIVNINCNDVEEIMLFNAVGQRIESIRTNGSELVQINMADLPCGVYVLQALSRGHILTRKIVKAE